MRKRALVVGIGNYATLHTLLQAPKDAERIGTLLTKAGWDVEPVVDDGDRITRCAVLWERTHEFFMSLRRGDNALFYFAGHAQQDGHDVRLVGYEGLLAAGGVSFSELKSWIPSHANSVTLMLDCCNSGDFIRLADNLRGERKDISVFAACGPSEKAWSDPRNGSVFTKYLLDGLGNGSGHTPGEVTPLRLRDYIEAHYAFELLDISKDQWQEPHSRVAEHSVGLVTIPESDDSPSREFLGDASPLLSQPDKDVEVAKEPHGLTVSWIVRPTGQRIAWQLPVPIRFDERPVAVKSTRDRSAVYVVLTGGGRTRVVKATEGAVLATMVVDGVGEIGPGEASFGYGDTLGKVSIGGLNAIDLTGMRPDTPTAR